MIALSVACGGCSAVGAEDDPPLLIFGRTGLGVGELSYPRAAGFSPTGELYVIDKAARMQVFSREGKALREWRMPEFHAGKPTGLGFDARGRVYVADTHYARVMIFEPDGTRVASFGSYGDGPGQFRFPTDVLVDRVGSLYVSEYGGNDRISKFTAGHEFVMSFDGTEEGGLHFERPQSMSFDTEGMIWIADACNHRICRVTPEGQLLTAFGRLGDQPGELRFPYGIEVLADQSLAVVEYGNNRVQRFDATGKCLGVWGRAGRRKGELAYPWAAARAADGRLFVVDSGNNRVQVVDAKSGWRKPR